MYQSNPQFHETENQWMIAMNNQDTMPCLVFVSVFWKAPLHLKTMIFEFNFLKEGKSFSTSNLTIGCNYVAYKEISFVLQ